MKVLVADDDATTRRMLCALAAKWGYQPVEAHDGQSAWAALQTPAPPRMLILDWHMPGLDGLSICREVRLRQSSNLPYTYIIFLTVRQETEDLVVALEAGADDYLAKPFDSRELEARMRAGRRIIELQDELLETKDQIERLSVTDPLTGALNRRGIMATLERAIADAMTDRATLSVLVIDLDDLKHINDTVGHAAGDAALVAATDRMRATIEPSGTLGRLGGDEFLAVLPKSAPDEASRLAQQVLDDVAAVALDFDGHRLALGASGGFATWNRAETSHELLARADAALYLAKAKGRARLALAPTDQSPIIVVKGREQ